MTTEEETPYWLGRASAEQQRLIKQHSIWTKSIGYLIHPSIASTLPPNAKIADIGTGTGIWMTSAAASFPSTYHFDGFDISDAQFLPQDTLPSNVSLSIADFKKPFPEEMQGKYDLVAIRLIIISMGNDVWESTLRNVLTLLKPGGAIQWVEGNFFVARGFRGEEAGSTSGHALTLMQRKFNATLNSEFGFNFPDFTSLFEKAGLSGVEEDVLSTDRLVEQRGAFTEIGTGAVLGGLRNLAKLKEGGKGEGYWGMEEVEGMARRVERDVESGAYYRWDLHVAVGFREGEEVDVNENGNGSANGHGNANGAQE